MGSTEGATCQPVAADVVEDAKPPQQSSFPGSAGDLARRAAEGDRASWEALVGRFAGMVWNLGRASGLGEADSAEVSQTVWLRLVEHLPRLEHPDRVGAWLVTTTRREARRVRERTRRESLSADMSRNLPPALDRSLDDFNRRERDGVLLQSVADLPDRCRSLLALFLSDPPIRYEDMADELGIPIGSIGPTRARCIAHLGRILQRRGITAIDGGSV